MLFVIGSKIQALFSPRDSKDKSSGKHWALLKHRDKVPTPEVKEDFPVYMRRKSSWESKSEGTPLHNQCRYAAIGLYSGIHLSQKLCIHLGEGSMDHSGVKRETIGQE